MANPKKPSGSAKRSGGSASKIKRNFNLPSGHKKVQGIVTRSKKNKK